MNQPPRPPDDGGPTGPDEPARTPDAGRAPEIDPGETTIIRLPTSFEDAIADFDPADVSSGDPASSDPGSGAFDAAQTDPNLPVVPGGPRSPQATGESASEERRSADEAFQSAETPREPMPAVIDTDVRERGSAESVSPASASASGSAEASDAERTDPALPVIPVVLPAVAAAAEPAHPAAPARENEPPPAFDPVSVARPRPPGPASPDPAAADDAAATPADEGSPAGARRATEDESTQLWSASELEEETADDVPSGPAGSTAEPPTSPDPGATVVVAASALGPSATTAPGSTPGAAPSTGEPSGADEGGGRAGRRTRCGRRGGRCRRRGRHGCAGTGPRSRQRLRTRRAVRARAVRPGGGPPRPASGRRPDLDLLATARAAPRVAATAPTPAGRRLAAPTAAGSALAAGPAGSATGAPARLATWSAGAAAALAARRAAAPTRVAAGSAAAAAARMAAGQRTSTATVAARPGSAGTARPAAGLAAGSAARRLAAGPTRPAVGAAAGRTGPVASR